MSFTNTPLFVNNPVGSWMMFFFFFTYRKWWGSVICNGSTGGWKSLGGHGACTARIPLNSRALLWSYEDPHQQQPLDTLKPWPVASLMAEYPLNTHSSRWHAVAPIRPGTAEEMPKLLSHHASWTPTKCWWRLPGMSQSWASSGGTRNTASWMQGEHGFCKRGLIILAIYSIYPQPN